MAHAVLATTALAHDCTALGRGDDDGRTPGQWGADLHTGSSATVAASTAAGATTAARTTITIAVAVTVTFAIATRISITIDIAPAAVDIVVDERLDSVAVLALSLALVALLRLASAVAASLASILRVQRQQVRQHRRLVRVVAAEGGARRRPDGSQSVRCATQSTAVPAVGTVTTRLTSESSGAGGAVATPHRRYDGAPAPQANSTTTGTTTGTTTCTTGTTTTTTGS
jgi:hypothetical protein